MLKYKIGVVNHKLLLKELLAFGHKNCNTCYDIKPLTEFNFRKDSKDGYRNDCKTCKGISDKEHHDNNKEYRQLVNKEYRKKNENKLKKKAKIFYDANAERLRKGKREYRLKYPDKQKESSKRYYNRHRERILEETKEKRHNYYYENKEKVLEQQNKYTKKRRKEDVEYRILLACRGRIRQALKNNKKSNKTKELIGCSLDELKKHLESKFYPQELPNALRMMTWSNYGFYGWHIDHIIPCEAFDLTNPEEQRKCFHWTNLQPLWAKENLSKGCKY
jgi:hypothetical protein